MTDDTLAKVKEEGRTYRRLGIGIEKMPPYRIDEWRSVWAEGWREEDAAMSRPLPPPIPEPKPMNDFGVSAMGDEVVILGMGRKITKAEAINLAAWLVALSGTSDEFQKVLTEVLNT